MKKLWLISALSLSMLLTACSADKVDEVAPKAKEPSNQTDLYDDKEYLDSIPDDFTFTANVTKINGTSAEVSVLDELNPTFAETTLVFVDLSTAKVDISVGDHVKVYFTGTVMESYPAQIETIFVEKIPTT